jgi:hypothetical protein
MEDIRWMVGYLLDRSLIGQRHGQTEERLPIRPLYLARA